MGEVTGIEWTNKTWNPWVGCAKVSPGCKHCYMFREQIRYGNNPKDIRITKTFENPLKWKEPALVFACSWSDWFLPEADEWRPRAWEIIKKTPWLTYQILTKRPQNIVGRLPADWGDGYENVWLGVSVESMDYIDRVVMLRDIPAFLRFISAEPLLAPLDLSRHLKSGAIGWVIAGGESGAGCRPLELGWLLALKHQCEAFGVPYFVKQLGGHPNKRSDPRLFIEPLRVREFPEVVRSVWW